MASPRILVIDDEEIVHTSIKRILLKQGFEVDGAITAQAGLEMMAEKTYDLVITDLMMPEMNGIEMLYAMKERGFNVPSIMVTGYPTIKTAIQALRLGALDYVPKPFTRQELMSPLTRALRKTADESDPAGEVPRRAGSPMPALQPGECFELPDHSWTRFNQDGTMDIGVHPGFLASLRSIDAIETPLENDLIEQGYPGVKIKSGDEIHGVFMPLSGRVVGLNDPLLKNPSALTPKSWLLKIIPSQLTTEIEWLRRCTL